MLRSYNFTTTTEIGECGINISNNNNNHQCLVFDMHESKATTMQYNRRKPWK